MANARDRGWGWPGAPGSAEAASYRRQHIVRTEVAGIALLVRREVEHLFRGFVTELAATTQYRLDVVADDWGWANRDIRGRPGVKSNHAWGLAIDLNAVSNPMTGKHPHHAGQPGHDDRGVHTDMPPDTGAIAARWGLTWGANYSGSRQDAMHFEFTGTPVDVRRFPLNRSPAAPPAVTWQGDWMPQPLDFTSAANCPTGGRWRQTAEGGIYADDGAQWLGAYNAHPSLANVPRTFVALVSTPEGGYVQVAHTGETYRWDPTP